MTTLAEAAAWHEERARLLEVKQRALATMGVPSDWAKNEIEKHKRFATAIREADEQ